MGEREFILGGQRSGKSRRAEQRAADWLAASPANKAVLIATAEPWDEEMHERIAQHQADRAVRVPGLLTIEEPLALSTAVRAHSAPDTMEVVECLTMWLTNLLMPAGIDRKMPDMPVHRSQPAMFLVAAIREARGPLVLVGNEIGMGVIPMGREVRNFVDSLGGLNQQVAAACDRVTLMVAGLPLVLKEPE